MKSCGVVVLFAFLAVADGYGQSVANPILPRTFVGFSISGNQSWVERSSYNGFAIVYTNSATSPAFGYKAGLNVYHELSPHFFLEGSLAYVFQQSNLHQEYSYDDFLGYAFGLNFRSSFSWVELPICISYSYPLSPKVSLFAGTGIAVKKLAKSEMKITSTNLSNGMSSSYTVDGRVNEWGWFPSVNFGTVIRTSDASRLTIKLSYERNISKLSRSPQPDYYLHALILSVGYLLNLGSLK